MSGLVMLATTKNATTEMRITKVEFPTAEQTKRTHEREEEEEPSFFREAGGTKLASPVSQAGFAPCELPSYL
ncbi:hypothetical protein F2Q69_00016908 [Brassica cretica]|uniref:Uncharacterized protein n=1 Tax=Brassica cretica TaxID=69181 RepID=A0A8S9R737_BRACR|nr:hypothetical protein F2Q69_00016908 [Brassica cretica]